MDVCTVFREIGSVGGCHRNRLRRLLSEDLAELLHLEGCGSCRAELEGLAADSEWWHLASRYLGASRLASSDTPEDGNVPVESRIDKAVYLAAWKTSEEGGGWGGFRDVLSGGEEERLVGLPEGVNSQGSDPESTPRQRGFLAMYLRAVAIHGARTEPGSAEVLASWQSASYVPGVSRLSEVASHSLACLAAVANVRFTPQSAHFPRI